MDLLKNDEAVVSAAIALDPTRYDHTVKEAQTPRHEAEREFNGFVMFEDQSLDPSHDPQVPEEVFWRFCKGVRGAIATESLSAGLGFGHEIDLTRAGLAQTTMASVEIIRGIASGSVQRKESKTRKPLFGLGWLSKDNDKDKSKGKGKDPHVVAESPLGFTAYLKPPVYVGGSSVLVQVWAVGLDGADAQLVSVDLSSSKQPPADTSKGEVLRMTRNDIS
ncbi:hypothetical protein AZE42_10001 [Rhizopogon vesiculosus]|uniref:Uncharacterized protein n=1 Tax=Rhizopogon vesiculosus TaxID=180088 RepID=A0A1J8Q132_9AGAM|nr:hypothetical protein AZE42_10001 [Rhizopogon vesiculosus]